MGVYGEHVAKAPPDIRSLARSHGPDAINTLAGIMREGKRAQDRINASVALLDRGYGRPKTDPETGEHLTVTIRKILEGGVAQVIDEPPPIVIEHARTDEENET